MTARKIFKVIAIFIAVIIGVILLLVAFVWGSVEWNQYSSKKEAIRMQKEVCDTITTVDGKFSIYLGGFSKKELKEIRFYLQQGKLLAKNLLNIIEGKATEGFKYFDKGAMATVGRNRAVVDIGKIRFQGIFAWFTWMFVHLMTLVGFRNKLVVFVNWVWSYFSYDRGTRLIIRPFIRAEKWKAINNLENTKSTNS